MRALLIGVGNAGCRIVDMLTAHDLESSVKSVRSYIFNPDQDFLNSMKAVDTDKRILLSPNRLDAEDCKSGVDFDLSNITGYFDDAIIDEADAVFVCAGLGGKMGEALPAIISQMNATFVDPIFTILTIPARNEGARVSARAAAELEAIREVASAEIIFDNETWLLRLEEEHTKKHAVFKESQDEDGNLIRDASKLTVTELQDELNELLTHRVELLLRAGEITENGIETAEAVLDAGEVLNTLTDTDIVSIGYSVEQIPKKLLGFLNRFRMEKYLLEEGRKRTARIVNLAKRAVYEEVSIPCDLTTADKALILITGPSNELSMKGFQTIRKWIDNSIKGLEMRAGDYPVRTTKDVGVIIVLAGIENVPRITELNEIRASYDEELKKKYHTREDLFAEEKEPEIRAATDGEIFEDGDVLNIGSDVPQPQGYEANLGYAAAMTGTETVPDITYPGNNPTIQNIGLDETVTTPNDSEIKPEKADGFQESDGKYDGVEEDPYEEKEEYPEENNQQNPLEEYAEEKKELFVTEEFPEENIPPKMEETAEDDVFEDKPIPNIQKPIPEPEPVPATTTETATAGASIAGGFILPKSQNNVPEKRKADPQIFLGGKKKNRLEQDSAIPLPKRNKQPDMVLSGQADLGKRKILKEGLDRTSIGSGIRPKETDGNVSVGNGIRPKETDGNVSVGNGRRPKETDGNVSVGARQLPREGGRAVSVGTKLKPNDDGRAVSVGTKLKPNDDGGAVSVGTKQTPKEIGNAVKVTEKKPVTKDVWKTVREAQKKRETSAENTSGTAHNLKWM